MPSLNGVELLALGCLAYLSLAMTVACVLLWSLTTRREPRALGWEVVDSVEAEEPSAGKAMDDAMPNPPLRRRRTVRPVDYSAPWDHETAEYQPTVTFPDELVQQWPDERSPAAKLPDEG